MNNSSIVLLDMSLSTAAHVRVENPLDCVPMWHMRVRTKGFQERIDKLKEARSGCRRMEMGYVPLLPLPMITATTWRMPIYTHPAGDITITERG
jgi:hypothetical protein